MNETAALLRPGGCTVLRSPDPAAPEAPPVEAPRGLTIQAGDTDMVKLQLMDTWQSDLWHADRWLLANGEHVYVVDAKDPGRPLCKAKRDDAGTFAWEHRSDDLAANVSKLQGLRALQPQVAVKAEQSWWYVRNDDDKIVVRLLEHRWDSGPRTLRVVELRGYAKEAAKVRALLPPGATTDAHPLQVAMASSGFEPRTWTSKPALALTRKTTGKVAATEMLRRVLELTLEVEDGIHADTDTEFLHDYRVLLRRARSVLSVMKGVFSEEDTLALKVGFKEMASRTNLLRDLDVHLLGRDAQAARVPEDLRADLDPFFDILQKERNAEHRRLSRFLRSAAYKRERARLAEQVARAEAGPNGGKAVQKLANKRLHKALEKVVRQGRDIHPDTPDEAVHELRLSCKKLRYTLELFKGLYDAKHVSTMIKRLKKLQDVLGEFNDSSVQKIALRDWVERHPKVPGRTAFAIGALYDALHRDQLAQRAQVEGRFALFDTPKLAAQVKAMTGRPLLEEV